MRTWIALFPVITACAAEPVTATAPESYTELTGRYGCGDVATFAEVRGVTDDTRTVLFAIGANAMLLDRAVAQGAAQSLEVALPDPRVTVTLVEGTTLVGGCQDYFRDETVIQHHYTGVSGTARFTVTHTGFIENSPLGTVDVELRDVTLEDDTSSGAPIGIGAFTMDDVGIGGIGAG